MSENPYQSPAAEVCAAPPTSLFRVEGNLLVVRSGAVLPRVCVKTNQLLSPADMKLKQFTWCSPLVALWFLVSGLLVILFYFVFRKHCRLQYGVTPEVRRKYRNRIVVKIVVTLASVALIPIGVSLDAPALFIVGLLLLLVSLIALCVGNAPLAVKRHDKGEFWLSGCSPEFLARLQATAAWHAGTTPFA